MKRNQPERRSNGGHGKATELGVRRGGASGGAREGMQRRWAPHHRALNMLVEGDFILKVVGSRQRV